MTTIVVLNERGNEVPLTVKQILTIDGMPYVGNSQEIRETLINHEARLQQLEKMPAIVIQQDSLQGNGEE